MTPLAPCCACLTASTKRQAARTLSTSATIRVPVTNAPTSFAPIASTSRMPGASYSIDGASLARPDQPHGARENAQMGRRLSVPAPKGPSRRMLAASPAELAFNLAHLLRGRQPKYALHVYLTELSRSPSFVSSENFVSLLRLFIEYGQISCALEALKASRRKGWAIPASIAKLVITNSASQIVSNPAYLETLVEWVKQLQEPTEDEMERSAEDRKLGAHFALAAMDALKRVGQSDAALEIFANHIDSAHEGDIGRPEMWAEAIRCKASDRDIDGAQELFFQWRTLWFESRVSETLPVLETTESSLHRRSKGLMTHTGGQDLTILESPPAEPYLALLNFLAIATYRRPAERDAAYSIVSLLHQDRVRLSTPVFNALLRVELQRAHFTSFWGLLARMMQGGWQRDHMTWRLCIQALIQPQVRRESSMLRASSSRGLRTAHRPNRVEAHRASPLQREAGYPSQDPPTARALYRSFLDAHREATGGKRLLVLPGLLKPIMSTITLNTFLKLFLQRQDWVAVAHVLEAFKVYGLDPNERTHGQVVVGLVKLWEKGNVVGIIEEEDAMDRGQLTWDNRERTLKAQRQSTNGMQLIARILQKRREKHAAWDKEAVSWDEEAGDEKINVASGKTPERVATKELRDVGYLIDLLRSCSGASEDEWVQLRAEALNEFGQSAQNLL
ncbi:BZ3500_MvSof-1268-A1-R1_Chr4-4g07469 [Microbotryum saponariae]|uniref:BZ3500_MvSof-1268-A1-R1_Chr4-4g07469 protein n=1 Tax=Microbotryum saponariae TaxID=289078 RepID=A0A2X0LP12_9BASI|nr:BZ3500_MvSof-1268-A1-R1_Chr4-4g07469 [Microbotryum saponariae]SDA07130.1 BZ3501_MvSof-1269-A2-R1_Chr4-3g07177 [Microbotryum saponariae]